MSVTKMYSVLDKWTDLEKENIVDFTSVDGTVTQARLNGVPVGGGGGGTANLVVNVDTGTYAAFYVPYIVDGVIKATFVNIDDTHSQWSYEVPIGPSGTLFEVGSGVVSDISGSVENYHASDYQYLITGNCSITFSGGSD